MRASLGLIGRDRLRREGLGLAGGSQHAGDVQNYFVHEDEVRRMGDEESR